MPPIRKQALGIVIGLSIQYLLGTAINFFVKFPESGGEAQMWEFAKTQPLVWAHIIIGLLLFLNAIFIVYRAVKKKDKVWKVAGGFGILAIFGALFAGESFVSNQNDNYSFLMALSFILAVLSYTIGIYHSKNN